MRSVPTSDVLDASRLTAGRLPAPGAPEIAVAAELQRRLQVHVGERPDLTGAGGRQSGAHAALRVDHVHQREVVELSRRNSLSGQGWICHTAIVLPHLRQL